MESSTFSSTSLMVSTDVNKSTILSHFRLYVDILIQFLLVCWNIGHWCRAHR